MKYLEDDGVFSLKNGSLSIDWSIFTDSELDTHEPDLTLMTQRTERGKTYYYRRYFRFIKIDLM